MVWTKNQQVVGERAEISADSPYNNQTPFYSVGETGKIEHKVLIDLEIKDFVSFWRMNERKLWLIISGCGLYFLIILFGG